MEHKDELAPVADAPSDAKRKGNTDLPALKAELQHLDSSCKSVKVQLQPQSEKAIQSIADLSGSLNTLQETVTLLEDVSEDQVSPMLLKNTLERITGLEEPLKLMAIAVENTIVNPQIAILREDNKELSAAVKMLREDLEKISSSSEAQIMQVIVEPVRALQAQISQIGEQMQHKEELAPVADTPS
ncbi:hypothetical protein Trydic_g271, partial [Trypoxylus dichotomus]